MYRKIDCCGCIEKNTITGAHRQTTCLTTMLDFDDVPAYLAGINPVNRGYEDGCNLYWVLVRILDNDLGPIETTGILTQTIDLSIAKRYLDHLNEDIIANEKAWISARSR